MNTCNTTQKLSAHLALVLDLDLDLDLLGDLDSGDRRVQVYILYGKSQLYF